MADFSIDIGKFVGKAEGRMDTVVRKIGLDLHRGVVNRTPVDTGRAQNNWNVGIDNVDPSVTSEAQKNAGFVLAKAQGIIRRFKAGQVLWITNNVEYINQLERGSSKQSPAGMVAVTLRNYPGIVSKSVREAKQEHP